VSVVAATVSCVTPLAADLRHARRGPRQSAALHQPIAGTAQSCGRPTNRYQETSFIVTKKHRQFHEGAGGILAPLVFTCRVVGDIAPR
jgi:hypothetical protein